MKRYSSFLATLLVLVNGLTGCATYHARVHYGDERGEETYPATRTNLDAASSATEWLDNDGLRKVWAGKQGAAPDGMFELLLGGLIAAGWVCDTVASLVIDTLLLPFDAFSAKREKDNE